MAITLSEPKAANLRLSALVDIVGFAEMCGVKPLSIHAYRKKLGVARRKLELAVEQHGSQSREAAIARAALERAKEHPVPSPVAHVGNVPVWTKKQVADWIAERPGQGARSDLGD